MAPVDSICHSGLYVPGSGTALDNNIVRSGNPDLGRYVSFCGNMNYHRPGYAPWQWAGPGCQHGPSWHHKSPRLAWPQYQCGTQAQQVPQCQLSPQDLLSS